MSSIPRLIEMSDAQVATLSDGALRSRLDAAMARMQTFQSSRSRGHRRARAIWQQALATLQARVSVSPVPDGSCFLHGDFYGECPECAARAAFVSPA